MCTLGYVELQGRIELGMITKEESCSSSEKKINEFPLRWHYKVVLWYQYVTQKNNLVIIVFNYFSNHIDSKSSFQSSSFFLFIFFLVCMMAPVSKEHMPRNFVLDFLDSSPTITGNSVIPLYSCHSCYAPFGHGNSWCTLCSPSFDHGRIVTVSLQKCYWCGLT